MYLFDKRHVMDEHDCMDYLSFVENVCISLISECNARVIQDNVGKIKLPPCHLIKFNSLYIYSYISNIILLFIQIRLGRCINQILSVSILSKIYNAQHVKIPRSSDVSFAVKKRVTIVKVMTFLRCRRSNKSVFHFKVVITTAGRSISKNGSNDYCC